MVRSRPNPERAPKCSYHTVEISSQPPKQRERERGGKRWIWKSQDQEADGFKCASVTLENANQVVRSTCVICPPSGLTSSRCPLPAARTWIQYTCPCSWRWPNSRPGRSVVIKFCSRATARQSVKIIKSNVYTPWGPKNVKQFTRRG